MHLSFFSSLHFYKLQIPVLFLRLQSPPKQEHPHPCILLTVALTHR